MAATPFISFQPPSDLSGYDASKSPYEQSDSAPQVFTDAMKVRWEVFVKEQGVPRGLEPDADDGRCCHWVAYASVNTVTQPEQRDFTGNIVQRKKSVTKSEPIGTLRLVPFPHAAHPTTGDSYDFDDSNIPAWVANPEPPAYIRDRATSFHDGIEPYVKLGRMAVVKELRGHGVAGMLVRTAIAWLQANPTYFDPPVEITALEKLDIKSVDEIPKWKGLICVHANSRVEKMWQAWGFELDEGMGNWTEANMPHVGMFLRLKD